MRCARDEGTDADRGGVASSWPCLGDVRWLRGTVADQRGEGLGRVEWRVEGVGWRVQEGKMPTSGTTRGDGTFKIPLPDVSEWKDGKRLAVSFASAGFEQVHWILHADAASKLGCRYLTVRLRPNRREEPTPDPGDIDTLDSHYHSEGR